ncbi:Oligo-1,6-glucosidase [compost metagenome]
MVYGDYELLLENHDSIYAYTRKLGEEVWLVILNFFKAPVTFELPPQLNHESRELIISNYEADAAQSIASVHLRPYEARVYRLHGVRQ